MIDWPFIEQQYQIILRELLAQEPLSHWSIKPQGLIKTSHKTKYGMADLKGYVHINHAFIDTTATQLLDATIRHEFAHLSVGLKHGHNQIFKAKAQQFKANFKHIDKSQHQQVSENIGHKYELYAQFKDGSRVLLKKVQRKHKKYTHYRPTLFRHLTIQGKKVISFIYLEK